jgi:hypothetical protein
MSFRELGQMAVGSLFRRANPLWKVRHIAIVRDEGPTNVIGIFYLEEQISGLRYRRPVLLRLAEYPHKAKLRDGARRKLRNTFTAQPRHPVRHPPVELVFRHRECKQGVYVEQIFHGKSARISRTSALVSFGELAPAVKTGNPVTSSRMIRAFRERSCCGVRIIRSPSTFASSESPARRPSFRRILLGTTTCPLVETRVCMVRTSYPISHQL